MSIFNSRLDLDLWKEHLGQYFVEDNRTLRYDTTKYDFIQQIQSIGTLKLSEEVPVIHLRLTQTTSKARVKIARLAYTIIKEELGLGSALFFVDFASNIPDEQNKYRLSYVKLGYGEKTEPKRYTFRLGEGVPVHTPNTRIKKSSFDSIQNIEEAFSVEPVNREFYTAIQSHFDEITTDVQSHLTTLSSQDAKQFTLRFLGRILFSWFLREKKLIPKDLLSSNTTPNYYQTILEPLFFNVLNQTYGTRTVLTDYEKEIPFLNGGLFTPQDDDYVGTIIINDEIIKDLLKTFELYNFTVDESTPSNIEMSIDPEMLGRVFENLLAEINPETGKSARKSTGSFYTPREIVDYMVVESLKQYFKNILVLDDGLLDFIFHSIEEIESNQTLLEKREEILNAIHNIKILDPACGSGAFPMGILQRIFILIERLDPTHDCYKKTLLSSIDDKFARSKFEEYANKEQFDYAYKMKILRDCIYGVDIQESATEISRLRAFLSLIVEEKIDDTKDNRGIEALPNLQFQFITANSLVGLDIDLETETFESTHLNYFISKIQEISEKTFSASTPEEKKQLEIRFEALMGELRNNTWIAEEDKQKLSSYHPFKNTPSKFFEPHIQFGIDKDKNFDIVIANPPYVQIQSMDNSTKSLYQEQYYDSYTRVGDFYQLFYERAFNLLSETGVVSMITSNKWMRAGYGVTTRSFFQDYCHVYKLLDLGGGRFESATVDTNIIFYGFNPNKNGKPIPQEFIPAISYKESLEELRSLQDSDITGIIQNSSDAWIILSEVEKTILDKMKKVSKPLKDWDISINRGVLTGFNEAFIIDGITKDRLIAEDSRSAEIIKPLLRGRDIKRYSYEFADKWLIATFPTLHLDISKYPVIKKYLEKFRPRIDQTGITGSRKKTPNQWFETQDTIAYHEDFDKPKIVWGNISTDSRFCYSPTSLMINAPANILIHKNNNTDQLFYILGVLNSTSFNYQFINNGITLGKAFEWKRQYIEPLLIPITTLDKEKEIIKLVDKILKKKKRNEDTAIDEREIDFLVYKLYRLTEDEIEIVENSK